MIKTKKFLKILFADSICIFHKKLLYLWKNKKEMTGELYSNKDYVYLFIENLYSDKNRKDIEKFLHDLIEFTVPDTNVVNETNAELSFFYGQEYIDEDISLILGGLREEIEEVADKHNINIEWLSE